MVLFSKPRKSAPVTDRLAPDRLDVRLLQSSAVTLYHKQSILAQDLSWLQQAGYRAYMLDAVGWKSPADFHADVKRELALPDHYAGNLASWLDCLGDLDVPREGGVVMQVRHFDAFARHEPRFAHTLLDSIESASRRFLLLERRLLALVQSDDPRIRFDRIGAAPVNWNPREWLDADRGLRPAS
jgi:RNAse (barnase) inhibitor barstar